MKKAIEQYQNHEENGMSVSAILKLNDIPKASFYVELKKINVEGKSIRYTFPTKQKKKISFKNERMSKNG